MEEYQLQILRDSTISGNYQAAVGVLNSYQYHHIGQPVAVRYYDEQRSVRVLFALGKRDCEDLFNGQNCGPAFYEIINKDAGSSTGTMIWLIIGEYGPEPDGNEVRHIITEYAHTDLPADPIGAGFYIGDLLNCSDGFIARVTRDETYEYYGGGGSGAGSNLNWESLSGDPEQPVGFKYGSQDDYEDTDPHEGGTLYVTKPTGQVSRLYKGNDLLGDSYVSGAQPTDQVTSTIGGILEGTTLSSLLTSTDGSVSKVLDMILFPTYAPQYIEATHSISFTDPYLYIYSQPWPDPIITDTFSHADALGRESVFGGVASITNKITKSGAGISDQTPQTPGEYLYTSTASFGEGTTPVVDSKGNPTNLVSKHNQTTLLSDTSNLSNTHVDGTSHFLAAEQHESTAKLYVAYPIYVGQPGNDPALLSPIGARNSYEAVSKGIEVELGESYGGGIDLSKNWYIDIPSSGSLSVRLRAIDGTYPETQEQQIAQLQETVVHGDYGSYHRYVYNGAHYNGGTHKIKINMPQ